MSFFEALGQYVFFKEVADAQVTILKGINQGVTTLLDAGKFDLDKILDFLAIAEKAQINLGLAVEKANAAAAICKRPRLHWD